MMRQRGQTRVKIKNRAKIEKSIDAFLAFPLEATFHTLIVKPETRITSIATNGIIQSVNIREIRV
jgi:hypothetical protein